MHTKEHHVLVHPASLKPHDWLRFVQVPPFPGQWARLGLADDELRALELCIMAAPKGVGIIPGTGGLRKGRFALPDSERGKSGSFRVFYLHFVEYGIVVLVAIIAKSQNDNLSKADRNALRMVADRLKRLLDKGEIQ